MITAYRPHIGALLQRPARLFEAVLIERLATQYPDATVPHTTLYSVIDLAGTPIGVLAQRVGVSKQAMSQLVDDLVVKGYVERREDPQDRRSRIVTLTDKGLALFRAARRQIIELARDYARQLGLDRFRTLCDLLGEIQPATLDTKAISQDRRLAPEHRPGIGE